MNDASIVELAVQQDCRALQFAGKVYAASAMRLRFASAQLRGGDSIMELAVQQYGRALDFAFEMLRKKASSVELAVQQQRLVLAA